MCTAIYQDVTWQIYTFPLLSCVWLFVTPWTAARRLPCPSPTPRACPNSCPLSRWCHPTISSSVVPFSCLQSFLYIYALKRDYMTVVKYVRNSYLCMARLQMLSVFFILFCLFQIFYGKNILFLSMVKKVFKNGIATKQIYCEKDSTSFL